MAPRKEPQFGLGRAIRQLRISARLSQEDLGHRIGIHPTWISHVERGANPAWATVKRIANGLGVSMGELAALADRLDGKGAAGSRK